ncbi:hypothetical protein MSAN_00620900 [Mycena sanguinolenta]|uniref:Uncharacterized protein n=1 Tax=Mycena sanguinolenta TaxID=230812 RepID=A0A8H6Z2T4_9AGAR|nr:hypothetical protein MSAN_00620900 [Mycena sanguinolenta]
MSNSSTSGLPQETASELFIDKTTLLSPILTGVAYGMLVVLVCQTLLLFKDARRKPLKSQRSWVFIAYVLLIFTLATIAFAMGTRLAQLTFVENKDFPGGPGAYVFSMNASIPVLTADSAYVIMSWLADGLMLWRFTLIYGDNRWLALFPGAIYLGSVASSILFLTTIAQTGSILSVQAANFALSYWSLTISLNIILALAIAGRILYMRHQIHTALGEIHSKNSLYISVAAIIIESAALTAVWSLAFIICYPRNTVWNILISPMGQITGISPVLILFRVARGRAWTASTMKEATSGTLEFNHDTSLNARGTETHEDGTATSSSIPVDPGHKFAIVGNHSEAKGSSSSQWEETKV